MILMEPTRI